ncbi:MAG: hypothetical protein R3199_05850 [Gemmatimonadota bacterium]|nr:hypothetical protein [Gemmatimonadota bacterium]
MRQDDDDTALAEILKRFGEDTRGDNVARMHRPGELFYRTNQEA